MVADVQASIITIGDELLIGQTIDTNSAFIAQELNKIGVWVRRRVAVGDSWEEIWNALDEEGRNSRIVILTGGLGPTADDITKPLLCEYFGGKMVVNESVLNHIIYLFEKVYRRPGPILERNLKQAEVPDVCTVLHNARGSAPGMWFFKPHPPDREFPVQSAEESLLPVVANPTLTDSSGMAGTVYVSLPGVPHEMKGLLTEEVIPRLLKEFIMPAIIHKTAFTAGQGESMIAERLMEFEASLPAHIRLAYLPHYGMVRLRLTAKGMEREETEKEITPWFEKLKELVNEWLVTGEDEGLEKVIGRLLKEKRKTMGTAESCTGGTIAHLITAVPGASAYFKGTVVCYANEVKEDILNVNRGTLIKFGAVSEETVREMAAGAVNRLKVDYVVATSGIMGPDGGSGDKPVGTVWIAAGNAMRIETIKLNLRFDRERNIAMTAAHALNFLRRFILADG